MVTHKMKVIWSDEARLQLRTAYNHIKKDSPQNARKVRLDIVSITGSLPVNSGKYPPDKYKLSNDGSYRVFEKHKYRVVYRVLEKEIRILRVRHTGMEPITY